MSKTKNNHITIDLDLWTTQVRKARERGVSIQYINKLIRLGKLRSLKIDEIGVVLVEK